jgi:protein-ribulosamine 3-kinase
MDNWQALTRQLETRHGIRLVEQSPRRVAGGDIHRAYCLESDRGRLFIKTNRASELENFQAERAGLQELSAAGCVVVPRALASGQAGGTAYLVLEWLALARSGQERGARLGSQLAALHRYQAKQFGFSMNNFIGRTPQPNAWLSGWVDFYRERRLAFQLELAERHGYSFLRADGQRLLGMLDDLLRGHDPVPSLLHGDLWAGNCAGLANGEPVIYDPAVYYGDRETDLAMTRLFGGFGEEFYRAYEAAWPLPEGWQLRDQLYQLYHIINHANLFGAGYARDAHERIRRLLSELA